MKKNDLLKKNLKKYLSSKITGGLYGLTISDEEFVPEMIKVIKKSLKNKKWKAPKEAEYEDIFS